MLNRQYRRFLEVVRLIPTHDFDFGNVAHRGNGKLYIHPTFDLAPYRQRWIFRWYIPYQCQLGCRDNFLSLLVNLALRNGLANLRKFLGANTETVGNQEPVLCCLEIELGCLGIGPNNQARHNRGIADLNFRVVSVDLLETIKV